MSKKVICLLFGVFMFICVSTANAFTVNVDTGAYTGQWHLNGAYHRGPKVFDLTAGDHTIRVGSGVIVFNVDTSGNVTNPTSLTKAIVSGDTLTFKTTPVTIDAGAWQFQWYSISGVAGVRLLTADKVRIHNLVPDMLYKIEHRGGVLGIEINVDAAGNVTTNTPHKVTVSGTTVTFITTPITFDAGLYEGAYGLKNNSLPFKGPGLETVELIPDTQYNITVGSHNASTDIIVDIDGKVTSLRPTSMTADGTGTTITFLTVPVDFDVVAYESGWSARWASSFGTANSFLTGNQTINLVLDGDYQIVMGSPHSAFHTSIINVDASGDVTSQKPTSMIVVDDTVRFLNKTVHFDVSGFTGAWSFSRGLTGLVGDQTLVFVPDGRYGFNVGSWHTNHQFNLDSAGNATSLDPDSLTAVGNTVTFLTAPVTIDPGAFTGAWSISTIHAGTGGGWFSGIQTFQLVTGGTGRRYRFVTSGLGCAARSAYFQVASPCGIDVPEITLCDFEFSFSCQLNNIPEVDAGGSLMINSDVQSTIILNGTVTDPDVDDVLTYRWLKNGTEILGTTAVAGGSAPLDLSSLSALSIGEHTLTLEGFDGVATVTDEMTLTIGNSTPTVAASGGGTLQVGTVIALSGQVSDFDGDTLNYSWSEGGNVLTSGTIATVSGGTLVYLTPFDIIAELPLGVHTITLEVNDDINDPVSADITVTVTDTTAPSISATVSPGILWPPNHKMVDVIIQANASDNSDSVVLTATVESSAPSEIDGDGNTIDDFTEPLIDQENGIITLQLRAERKGKGAGRTYTITVTATDDSGNSSDAIVEVVAPHDKGKK